MRVCVDIQSTMAQRAGVGRYTRLLVQHLSPLLTDDTLSLFYFDFMRRGTPFATPQAAHKAVRWCPGRAAQLAWKTIQWPPFNLFAGPADIYHFPNFILPPLNSGKSIVTIHDMSFLRFPQFAEERNRRYLSSRIRDTVARADAIITDSLFSASEIHELLNIPPDRMFPIHLGIGNQFKPIDRARVDHVLAGFDIKRPYILTVGTIEPRKNIPLLVKTFEMLSDFDGFLVVAGMPGWKCEPILKQLRTSPRASNIRYLKYVDDSQLPALYAGADLFAFTSRYEGFGFPPLEAMACGTPVVSSSAGSLKEVLGNGAALLDSFEPYAWTTQIRQVLSDSEYRKSLISEGRRRARTYTWVNTAQKTWDVYRKVAG